MNEFYVQIYSRDFSQPLTIPKIKFSVNKFSHAAIGGPDAAEIEYSGDERAVWEMLEWLRAPIEILDARKTPVWWGYIDEIEVSSGAVSVASKLENMANRCAVAYSSLDPGAISTGTRATTTWTQDDDSVSTYGTKEILATVSNATSSQANSARNAVLEQKKYPITEYRFNTASERASGRIRARGWWHTLAWRYYACLAGKEAHESGTTSTRSFGNDGWNIKVAQSFRSSVGGWNVGQVKIKLKKVGSPSDNAEVSIRADYPGVPGNTDIVKVSKPGSQIGTTGDWITFDFTTATPLCPISAATTFWVVVGRSGGFNGEHYYQVEYDSAQGYSNGTMVIQTDESGSWGGFGGDLYFQVLGAKETTQQIADIVSAKGQFLTGTDITNASGVLSNQYRDGDQTAAFEAEELLKSGTTNNRRLLATVTPQREIRVYEEPAFDPYTVEYYIKKDGTVENRWGDLFAQQSCPVGAWAMLKDVIPSSLDYSRMADPTKIFIDSAEYDVKRKKYIPTAREQPDAFSIATKIVEG